jgi:hypothetical protein
MGVKITNQGSPYKINSVEAKIFTAVLEPSGEFCEVVTLRNPNSDRTELGPLVKMFGAYADQRRYPVFVDLGSVPYRNPS